MKFLCLVEFEPDAFDDATSEDMRRLDDATISHDNRLRAGGHLLIASPLVDAGAAVTLDRRPRGRHTVIDGPFAEAKEVIGGFLLIEARDMEEAVALFHDDPILTYGRMQIRPLMEEQRHSETGEARPAFQSA